MAYSALDNIENAKKLIRQLQLEYADLDSSLEYDSATSVCSDCPARIDGLEYNCCKYTGAWEEAHQSDFEHMEHISKLILALTNYATPGEVASLKPDSNGIETES